MQFVGLGNFIRDGDSFLYHDVTVSPNVTSIKLSDGYFMGLYVSSDPSLEQYGDGVLPEWNDDTTILSADFDGTCNGNKSEIDLQTIDGIVIKKRRKDSTQKWQTMYVHNIGENIDVDFTYIDYLCRNNCDYQYRIAPLSNGNETYNDMNLVVDVRSEFDGSYFTDGIVQYGSRFDNQGNYSRNTSTTTIQPINSKYPIAIKNGHLNYSKGSITMRLLDMDEHDMTDVNVGYYYRSRIIDFLSDSRVLVFKNYDGFMAIVALDGEISEDFSEYYLAPKMSISWTQVGDAEDYKQLKRFGFIRGDTYEFE